jgi:phosphatidylcholine synthase
VRVVFAWAVHLFTAAGAVLGAWALLAVAAGSWHVVMLLMLAAFAVDCLDGTLARRVGVAWVLPEFDGRRLDDIVDYLNYAIVPVVFLVASGLLPHWAWALPPVLASAYGFGQVEAKTEDDFFLGWPSYWNVVAIYAWLLDTPAWLNAGLTALFSLLVFVPFKYIYPSRLRAWKRTTYTLVIGCGALVIYSVIDPARGRAWRLVEISLLLPIWYVLLSFRLGGLRGRTR